MCIVTFGSRFCEMAQRIKAFATPWCKLDDLSWIPGTQVKVDGENWFQSQSLDVQEFTITQHMLTAPAPTKTKQNY